MGGTAYGLHRVLSPKGALPQRAERLDVSLPIGRDELLVDVDYLNIDAASFQQLKKQEGSDPRGIGRAIQAIVAERGKMQNPITGSGGMLVGRVKELGPEHPAARSLKAGDRIASLISLTLTPLVLDEIREVHVGVDRVDVKGRAILFASSPYTLLPDDMPETLALAALDVCGAPALVKRYVRPGMNVLVLGSGKSGSLCCAQAMKSLQGSGKVLALDISQPAVDWLKAEGLCHLPLACDATQPVAVMERVAQATAGRMCDLVVNCASVPGTEMASVLACRDGGTVLFFSMATSFTASTLGAEGVGKDVVLLMGNGYAPGHAALTLDLLRDVPALMRAFSARYAART